ncbi:hypothetical protein [Tateyamaria sp. SN6-1]|uniref:hypothetical protein n=1 Tax=Tateyamaria sp. SN6-1 TaxID=3092148 RepID=UPI0039F580FA
MQPTNGDNATELLARLADHLDTVVSDILDVEAALDNCVGVRPDEIVDLQKIDHVSQRLADVSILLRLLSSNTPFKPDVVQSLKLAETRALVSGEFSGTRASGGVDLF